LPAGATAAGRAALSVLTGIQRPVLAVVLTLACFLAVPAISEGRTFYVSNSGSNGNPGTAQRPWRTIQRALDTLRPGQSALVRSGTYVEDLDMRRSGRRSAPITVAGYPGERPVLRSAGGHPLEVSSSGGYFRFRRFVIERHPGSSGGNIDIYGRHVEIAGNIVRYGRDQGIYTAEESAHVRILRNRIHHNGEGIDHQSHGIYLQGDDHLVANNLIHDHPEGFGIQVYDEGSRARVVNNTVVGSGHSGIVVGGSGGVHDVAIRNNIFAFNSKWGIQHDSDCPHGTVADHNVLYGNRWGAVQRGCPGLRRAGGNRGGAPRFANLAHGDLRLRPGSAAVGAALASWVPRLDFSGRRRPQGRRPDAGAYEYP
jgi:Right handed beta helix region